MNSKKAFITGVSSGIGFAMAKKLLNEGYFVYGCSRTVPQELEKNAKFKHSIVDLSKFGEINECLNNLFNANNSNKLDLVFLNAGLFGDSPDLSSNVKLSNFQNVLDVNLTANKVIIDYLINKDFEIDICLISSSIAGVRLRAGTLSYAVSKAALNALIRIYALENPKIFFAVVGLCNVNTNLSKNAIGGQKIKLFPELIELKRRLNKPNYNVSPEERAQNIYHIISNNITSQVESGCFVEIRTLLNSK